MKVTVTVSFSIDEQSQSCHPCQPAPSTHPTAPLEVFIGTESPEYQISKEVQARNQIPQQQEDDTDDTLFRST